MKKAFYILLFFFLFIPIVNARIILDNYHIEIDVDGSNYKVKESFEVVYNDSYETMYEKSMLDGVYSNIESNVDELIKSDKYINFYLGSDKEYYINYDVVSDKFLNSSLFAQSIRNKYEDVIIYNKLSIVIKYNSVKEFGNSDISLHGKKYNEYVKDGNTISWEYENISNDYYNKDFASIMIKSNNKSVDKDNIFLLIVFIIPFIMMFITIYIYTMNNLKYSKKFFYILAIITGLNYLLLDISAIIVNSRDIFPYIMFVFPGLFFIIFYILIFFIDLKKHNNSTFSIILYKGFIVLFHFIFLNIILHNYLNKDIQLLVLGIIVFVINLELCSKYYLKGKENEWKKLSKYKEINSYHFKNEKKKC